MRPKVRALPVHPGRQVHMQERTGAERRGLCPQEERHVEIDRRGLHGRGENTEPGL